MKLLLKNAREQKGLKTREVSQILGIDQALVSKFESGLRKPTRDQVSRLAKLLEIDYETLMIAWLKEKILYEIENEEFALKALAAVEEELKYQKSVFKRELSVILEKALKEIDILKAKADTSFPENNQDEISIKTEIKYTFESNRLDGNSMTLQETEMVVSQGLTIPGKSMREHFEAVNHQEAIRFIKNLQKNNSLDERNLLSIHNLILRGINPENAGSYRKATIINSENLTVGAEPAMIPKEMENYFFWYEINKNKLHPVVLAAEMHIRLLKICPFAEANEKTARLIMNLILLQHGYPIAIIKENNNKKYEEWIVNDNPEDFIFFIARIQKESLEKHLGMIN